MGDDHRGRRAGDAAHVVMLGEPVAEIAEALGVAGEVERVPERLRDVAAFGDRREVENGKRNHDRASREPCCGKSHIGGCDRAVANDLRARPCLQARVLASSGSTTCCADRKLPTWRRPSKWSQNTLITTSSGTAISAPTMPQSHDQKATAMKIATALTSSRRPTISGVIDLPFDDVADDHPARREHGVGEAVERYQCDRRHEQDGRQRADIRQEVQQRRCGAPDERVGQADRPKAEPDGNAQPAIDQRDREQVARDLALDVIDDAQRPLLFAEAREGLHDLLVEQRARSEQEQRQHEGDGDRRADRHQVARRSRQDAGLRHDDLLHAGFVRRHRSDARSAAISGADGRAAGADRKAARSPGGRSTAHWRRARPPAR